MRKIVVIGAGAAGMAAATRARRVDPTAGIIVLEASEEYSRGTCSLPYYVSGEVSSRESLTGISLEQLGERDIDLRLRTAALSIDSREKRVVTQRGPLSYDRLIVSTGSRPRAVPLVGSAASSHPRLWRLRTIADADHMVESLGQLASRRVAVVGGGYLGLEMAEVLTRRGCRVTLFHRQSTLMRLTEPGHRALLAELHQHGVDVRVNCLVRLVDPDCRQRTIESQVGLDAPRSEGFDAVALAAGIEPEVSLLQRAGAKLGAHGGVLVDARGETSLAGIFAAGDGVELPSGRGTESRYIPLATCAARLGRVCGENACGGSLRLPIAHASIAVRLFSLQVAAVGHPNDWQDAEATTVEYGSERNPFQRRYPGVATFLTERRSGRLLGAQFVAPEASSLADLASLALQQEMRMSDLESLDASYTPPLSGLWHPFYLAAREAEKRDLALPGRSRA